MDQSAANVLASLLRQLVEQDDSIPDDIMNQYHSYSQKGKRLSLQESLKLLLCVIPRFHRIHVVIDALDECSTDAANRDQFLDSIEKILLDNVRVLFTSRDSVTETISRFPDAGRLDIRANDDDVRTFLAARIDENTRLVSHMKKDPSLRETMLSIITEKANGM